MYSGSTITNFSGNVVGTHQTIDRAARDALDDYLINSNLFPSKRQILRFEGKNGPDGMKKKSSAEAPWHFIDPFDTDDSELLEHIDTHYKNLVIELKNRNKERAAFESAWLAHAVVDGLTPAHQYPLERKLIKLWGGNKSEMDTLLQKYVAPGTTLFEKFLNNWDVYGPKGLMTTHVMFEMGVATIMMPISKYKAIPSKYDLKKAKIIGFREYFIRTAREIALLDIFERFNKRGWTPKLSKQIRKELAPKMLSTVTVAWYMAAKDAGVASSEI
jgi:hypothetical protein